MATVRRKAEVLGASASVGYRAAELGHELRVVREGKRFRIVCACGFRTLWNHSRKSAFAETLDHAIPAPNGDIPAVEGNGVSVPGNALPLHDSVGLR